MPSINRKLCSSSYRQIGHVKQSMLCRCKTDVKQFDSVGTNAGMRNLAVESETYQAPAYGSRQEKLYVYTMLNASTHPLPNSFWRFGCEPNCYQSERSTWERGCHGPAPIPSCVHSQANATDNACKTAEWLSSKWNCWRHHVEPDVPPMVLHPTVNDHQLIVDC